MTASGAIENPAPEPDPELELERDEDDPDELELDPVLPPERLPEYDCPPPGRASTRRGKARVAPQTAIATTAPIRAVTPPPFRQ
jgi:hypothetical protein